MCVVWLLVYIKNYKSGVISGRGRDFSLIESVRPSVGPIHPHSEWAAGLLLRGLSSRGVKLTIRFHLLPRLRIIGLVWLLYADTRSHMTLCNFPVNVLNENVGCKSVSDLSVFFRPWFSFPSRTVVTAPDPCDPQSAPLFLLCVTELHGPLSSIHALSIQHCLVFGCKS